MMLPKFLLSSKESEVLIQLNSDDIADIDIGMSIHSSNLEQEISKVIKLSRNLEDKEYSIDVL